MRAENGLRYCVYEATSHGAIQVTAEMEAFSDLEALKQVRELLPNGSGELRQEGRVVCRFGRVARVPYQG